MLHQIIIKLFGTKALCLFLSVNSAIKINTCFITFCMLFKNQPFNKRLLSKDYYKLSKYFSIYFFVIIY